MNKFITLVIASVAATLLGGCATTSSFFNRSHGEPVTANSVPEEAKARSVPEEAKTRVQGLLNAWPQGDKSRTITELEKLASQFSSPDGAWEIAVNSAIALAYLESGDVMNFKVAVSTLRKYIQPQKRLPRPTQYVLAVDEAMSGTATDEAMLVEYRISRVAHSLLDNSNGRGRQ